MGNENIIQLTGRREITTALTENATIEELTDDLRLTIPKHYHNRSKIDYLFKYWKGGQPIYDRTKEIREDIDNKTVVNLAQSATRQITGYTFGKPIEFIHKKDEDSSEMEVLNNCFAVQHKGLVDNEIFTDISICGLGYRLMLPTKGYDAGMYDMGKSPFTMTRLDPRDTFCVYSTEIPKRIVYSCTYNCVEEYDSVKHTIMSYTIFTVYIGRREFVYRVEGIRPSDFKVDDLIDPDGRTNLLGCPVIEYRNNSNLSGDWEIAMSIMDSINVVTSDRVNDVVQFVQSLLVFINAELDGDKAAELKKEKMLSLISEKGLPADVKYIAEQLDMEGAHVLKEDLESDFNNVVGVPDRKTRGGGGGDTGEAVKLRDGWGDLEILARNKEPYVQKGEIETLLLAIKSLMVYDLISDLKIYDIEIKFSRNKSDNLLVKTQSYSTLIDTQTITPEDAMVVCDFVNDAKEVAAKGKQYWEENASDDNNDDDDASDNMTSTEEPVEE